MSDPFSKALPSPGSFSLAHLLHKLDWERAKRCAVPYPHCILLLKHTDGTQGVWEMTVKMRWGVSDTSGKRSRAELESKWFFCPPGALTHERGHGEGGAVWTEGYNYQFRQPLYNSSLLMLLLSANRRQVRDWEDSPTYTHTLCTFCSHSWLYEAYAVCLERNGVICTAPVAINKKNTVRADTKCEMFK